MLSTPLLDGLNAGERGATAGKHFEQQPERDGFRDCGGDGSGAIGTGCPLLSATRTSPPARVMKRVARKGTSGA